MTQRRSLFALMLGLGALLLSACDEVDSNTRASTAAENFGPIEIALIWDGGQRGMLAEGALLAEEINNRRGILPFERPKNPVEGLEIGPPYVSIIKREDPIPQQGTRKLRLLRYPSPADAGVPRWAVRDQARSLSANPKLVAVIGHVEATTAVPASVKYEEQGILYINPAVTEPVLNDHGFLFTFTTIPDNEQIAKQIATFAFAQGYRRLGILNSRSDSAVAMANAFDSHAVTLGMTVVAKRSFFGGRDNYRDLLADFGAQPLDAMFLSTSEDAAKAIIRQGMEMNLNSPFLLSTFVDSRRLRAEVGCDTPQLTLPTLFNPFSGHGAGRGRWVAKADPDKPPQRNDVQAFRTLFKERFGVEPDPWAAQGYDAVNMLADAMTQADSSVPLSVATILRYTLSWNGITGRHSFDRAGSIYTKQIEFSTLKKGDILFYSPAGGVTPLPETMKAKEAACERAKR